MPPAWHSLPYYLPVAIYPLIWLAAVHGCWWLAGPFIFFGVMGPLEVFLGEDLHNLDPKRAPAPWLSWYNLPLWLCALLWPLTFIFALWQMLAAGHLAVWENALLAAILTVQGSGILVVGHELVHRRRSWEQYVGEFLFTSVSYPHYPLDHLYIHHPYVGTPKDTSSAPKGQSFYAYFPREVIGNFFGSWEAARKLMEGRQLPMWHYSNPCWRYGIETAAWYVLIFLLGGWWAVLVFMFCCLAVLFMMKQINYVQHYGLRRVRLPNGRYERVAARHTWGVDYKYHNWMFFNTQRHADHHLRAGRNYPLLQHFGNEECPALPGSYYSLSGLALRPKRWFEKMDPLVDQWRARFYPEIKDWSAYDSQVSIARPEAFEVIAEIFAGAPHLARAIEANPALLDTLQDKEFTDLEIPEGCWPDDPAFEKTARQGLVRVYWTCELGVAEMREQIAEISVRNAADAVNMLRAWSNNKVFQVGIHTLRGNLAPKEAGIALANIAEASLDAVLRATVEDVADGGRLPDGEGVAAVLAGDLAGREVAPPATLDILFVYQGDAARGQNLCRRFHDALGAFTRANLLFEPYSKRDQAALYPLDDFVEKYRSAAPDELLTLARARCLFSGETTRIKQRFDEARQRAQVSAHSSA